MSSKPTARPSKYAVLADLLRDQISGGVLYPGDRLPSLGEICTRYGYSLTTVDRALGVLERDGLVVRVNGSGIFVQDPAVAEPRASSDERPLGLILPNCQNGFFSQIIGAVERESRATGYHLMVANSYGDPEVETRLLQELSARTAGLCVMPCGNGNQAAFAGLLERQTPFVLLDRRVAGLEVPLVASDHERGGYLATRHLLEADCARVYVVSLALERASSLRERVAGFRKALAEKGMPYDATLLRQLNDDPVRLGYLLTRDLLEELEVAGNRRGKIGLFALNEMVARGCYTAIKERGWNIPEEIGVVGFDGTSANFFDPPLTAVRQDLNGVGQEGVRRLLELIRTGPAVKPRTVRLQPELVVRGSSDSNSGFCSVRHILQAPAAEHSVETTSSWVAA